MILSFSYHRCSLDSYCHLPFPLVDSVVARQRFLEIAWSFSASIVRVEEATCDTRRAAFIKPLKGGKM